MKLVLIINLLVSIVLMGDLTYLDEGRINIVYLAGLGIWQYGGNILLVIIEATLKTNYLRSERKIYASVSLFAAFLTFGFLRELVYPSSWASPLILIAPLGCACWYVLICVKELKTAFSLKKLRSTYSKDQ